MSLPDDELLELNTLCSALLDGTLGQTGRARLNELLADSEEARRFYVRSMALSASLHDYAGELQSDEPRDAEERAAESRKIVRVAAWRWFAGGLAAAAALALMFLISRPEALPPTELATKTSDDDSFVATLSASTDCRWDTAGPALGEELKQGRQLQLVSGLAEITFDSGAQVVLEGPATLDVTSAWEAVLRRGSLRANVPPEAVGFRVSNSDVEVTDLGTEFGMLASEGNGTEVFVLKGAVEASSSGAQAQPITLREQQARRFDRASITEVRDREQKVKRWAGKAKLVQFARPADYVHWSFDEADGTTFHAELIGTAPAQELDGRIDPANGQSAIRAAGHHERALSLDGRTVASVREPASAKAGKTLAFWVQVPEDAALTEAGPMLTLGENAGTEISWNRDPTQGTIGALRTETERGHLVGATSLRDGRWHHLAVVFGPNGKARQYVDGRLEAVSAKGGAGKHPKQRRAEKLARAAGSNSQITLGGRASANPSEREGFRGLIDELFFADRALTSPEIRQLQRDNRPTPPSMMADAGL